MAVGLRSNRAREVGLSVAALLLAIAQVGCTNNGDEPDPTPSASPALRARLEVPAVIVAGDQPIGEVVVENDTGNTVRIAGCGRPFQVRLHRDGVRELDLTWQSCLEDFLIPMGTSRWPVHVPTILANPDGVIPPGEYEATIHQNTTNIPAETVIVTVVERA